MSFPAESGKVLLTAQQSIFHGFVYDLMESGLGMLGTLGPGGPQLQFPATSLSSQKHSALQMCKYVVVKCIGMPTALCRRVCRRVRGTPDLRGSLSSSLKHHVDFYGRDFFANFFAK